jgi:hypothetical protein
VPNAPGLGIEIDESRIAGMTKRYERDGSYQQTGVGARLRS